MATLGEARVLIQASWQSAERRSHDEWLPLEQRLRFKILTAIPAGTLVEEAIDRLMILVRRMPRHMDPDATGPAPEVWRTNRLKAFQDRPHDLDPLQAAFETLVLTPFFAGTPVYAVRLMLRAALAQLVLIS